MAQEPGKAEGVVSVGAMLRELRVEEKRWRLRELSAVTGISVPYLNQIERDEVAKPSREKLATIAAALGADPHHVVREQEKIDLVREFGIEPQVAELMLRLREAAPDERDELRERFEELLRDVARGELSAPGSREPTEAQVAERTPQL